LVTNSNRRNPLLPALSFVPGLSLQIEVALDNLVSQFDQGRFGLQLAILSNESLFNSEDYVLHSLLTIDDEVTPGMFEIQNINLGQAVLYLNESVQPQYKPEPPAFIQIRPICYVSKYARDIKTSRDVKICKHRNITSRDQRVPLRQTVASEYFGTRMHQQFQGIPFRHVWAERFDRQPPVGIRIQNVSFGTPEDRFYKASSYLVWTFSLGFGSPPEERMSTLLIGLIGFSVIQKHIQRNSTMHALQRGSTLGM
uniref:ITA9 n=1 Tax=Echinostoma caproni TaxID=27848 RepID=A0A183AWR4_9TREM